MSITSNHSNDTGLEVELYVGYSTKILQFGCYSCIFFVVLGIPGNLITIIALATCKKFHNATAFLIINLHISNLLYCCTILPISATIYSTRKWIFGRLMCSIYPFMMYALLGTAHFTVVAITINRYIMVCQPNIYSKLNKKRHLILSIMSTWILAITFLLPTYFGIWGKFDVDPRGGVTCTIVSDKNNMNPEAYFLCLGFFCPFIIISACYARIWWIVRRTTKSQRAHNRKALLLTVSISSSENLVIETGFACPQPTVPENAEEQNCELEKETDLAPDKRQSVLASKVHTLFKMHKIKQKLQLPSKKDKRLATLIVVILITFTLCHLPIMVTIAFYDEKEIHPVANIFTRMLNNSAACINPILYVIMSVEYRQAYVKLFKNLRDICYK